MSWTLSALEVIEVCRPCMKWDCQGRTYAMDCYLKFLVRLCHIYVTVGGVKKAKDGASSEQNLAETRLQALQKQLVKDLSEVTTARLMARVIWALAEHFDLEGLDPLLADDPEDPLNSIFDHIHKVMFNTDSAATVTNRLQDVQALLVSSEHLGSRNLRAGQMLTKELEDFRNSALADSVNKHQCRLILQKFKYISEHPDSKWVGNSGATGDYHSTHHMLSVQYFDASAAQDRKLEYLVHTAVQELWRPAQSELTLASSGMIYSKPPPTPKTLSGCSDPCYVKAYHLTDPHERRLTLHLKILNLTEQELKRVDVRVGLIGALRFMDGSPQCVRQLQQLHSQDPILSSVTVGVSRFERCSLCVQLLYYPFFGGVGIGQRKKAEVASEEGIHGVRLRKNYSSEYGEPVVLRCGSYRLPLIELLVPYALSPVEFFRLWPSLPAITEYTGAYTYESVGLKAATVTWGYMEPAVLPILSGLKALSSKPFHKVCSHVLQTVAGFQICYAAKSWYSDVVFMMIFGTSEVSGDVDLGEETKTMVCKFVVRASSGNLVDGISADVQTWLDDLTDNAVRGVSDEEVEAAAAEKLKNLMEIWAVIRAKPKFEPKPELDSNSASFLGLAASYFGR